MGARRRLVLVVEDDPDDVALLELAFRKSRRDKAALQVVPDGEQAIEYLTRAGVYADKERYPAPALMVLDLKLARKTGFDTLRWLRSQDADFHRLPVVVLSSSREMTDVQRAYELGANSFLVKPGSFDDFVQIIGLLESYWLELNEQPNIG